MNPLVYLELGRARRRRPLPRRWLRLRLPYLALQLLAAVGLGAWACRLARGARGFEVALRVTGPLLAFVLPWMAPAYAAVVIAREREMGTLDLLRVTLLSNRSIVLGKLAGCLVRLWPTVLTLAVLAVPRAAWGTGEGLLADVFAPYVPPWMSQGGEWVLGLFDVLRPWTNLALFSAAGLAASAWTRSSGAAVAASYASLFVLQVAGLWLQDSLGVFWTVLGCLFEVGGVVLLLEAAARGLEWT